MLFQKTITTEDAEDAAGMRLKSLLFRLIRARGKRDNAAPRSVVCPLLIFLFLGFALSGCKRERLPDYPPAYREYAYVTNGGSNSVTVIDLMNNFRVAKTIAVGKSPTGAAINPAKNEVYVVNTESNNVSVIDAEQNAVIATIGVERSPYFIDVAADGRRGYVANSGSNSVSVIDLEQRKVIGKIQVGVAPGLARVSQDGKLVVTTNRGDDSLSIADAEKMTVLVTVPLCHEPTALQIMPDASKAFVACSGPALAQGARRTHSHAQGHAESPDGGQIAVVDLKSSAVLTYLDVGAVPSELTLKPDGGEIFSMNFGADSVSEIYTGANEVGGTRLMGGKPARGVVSADGSLLYVSNFGSDSISVYAIDQGKLLTTVQVGDKPDALALQPAKDGREYFLLAADSGSDDVAIVFIHQKVAAWTLFTMVPVGHQPRQIVIKPFMLRKPPR